MSHFYGTLRGNRGKTTRCGSEKSGIFTSAASYSGCVSVELYICAKTGKDMYSVIQRPWQGVGVTELLAVGEVGVINS